MKINIKNLFIFSTVYSGIYIFLINQFANFSAIKNTSNFNFLNLGTDLNNIMAIYGGLNSYYFIIFGYTLNFTFLLYIMTYFTLPFYFIIQFFTNIILLISYEISAMQYPISILPYGIGQFIMGTFYIIIIIVIITGIKIVQSGFGD